MAPLTAVVLPKTPSILVQSMACAWAPATVEAIMLQALRSLGLQGIEWVILRDHSGEKACG
jgi:hypothetical protein